jgi:hypothetical protein
MNRRRKSGVAGSCTRLVLKNEADGQIGKASGISRMTATVIAHSTSMTVPPLRASLLTSWYSMVPSPVTRDTEMKGITVICRSLMKTSPTIWSQPTMSPKKTPVTAPRPSPIRTQPARVSRRFRGGLLPFSDVSLVGSVMHSFHARHRASSA